MNAKDMLFAILRSQICEAELDKEIFDSFDEKAQVDLYRLSLAHDLAHIVANELLNLGIALNEKISAAFKKQQMIAIFRYEKLKKDLNDACGALEEAGIGYTPLKGSVLRNYYNEPWMRTSCDVDILVSENDLEAARRVLAEKLGCEDNGKSSHDVQMHSQSGMHIELHYALTEVHNLKGAKDILENYGEYLYPADGSRLDMSDELFYFYHMDHMAKHFQNGGCGIKPIMDLWVLENKVPHDREKRKELLKKGGLLTFASKAEKLMRVWFENKEHDDVTKLIEEYLLGGGVYGTLENRVAVHQHKQGGKFRYAISRIFLKYDQLKYSYPILEKHKWLFPFMQVARWFRLVFKGRFRSSVNELKLNSNMNDELSNKTRLLLERLEISE